MAYCSKCGAPLLEGSNFCTACGAGNMVKTVAETNTNVTPGITNATEKVPAVPAASVAPVVSEAPVIETTPAVPVPEVATMTSTADSGERVQEFAGKITKCPSCGEVLKALAVKCQACGFELREINNASSVTEFTDKLAKTISIKQKIELIRDFPIPNAKEDIFEFLVLATTNFETKKHVSAIGAERQISEAWLSKIEQAYVKAETLFKNDKDFGKFQEIYDTDIKELKEYEESLRGRKHYIYGTVLMLLTAIVAIVVMFIGSGPAANPRLDATIAVGFINGIMSYLYARRKNLKIPTLIVYVANAVMNIVFCFTASGHLINLLAIVACALGAFIEKNKN